MFDTIVLAVDRFDVEDALVQVTSELARKFQSDVVVLHVIEADHPALEQPCEAAELVDKVTRQLKEEGVRARAEVLSARSRMVAREIRQWAWEEGAGLIAIGSGRAGRFRQFLTGSTSHEVERDAHCPVLTVGY